jgi:hypothetical protein
MQILPNIRRKVGSEMNHEPGDPFIRILVIERDDRLVAPCTLNIQNNLTPVPRARKFIDSMKARDSGEI